MTMIKVQYDTEDPLCSIVKNLRLQAKEEVFDIEKEFMFITHLKGNNKGLITIPIELWDKHKKRHLSTFSKEKAT